MRFRMFPASASLLLLTCCAVPAAAQTNLLPRPIQKLVEDLQSSDKPSANLPSGAARSGVRNKTAGDEASLLDKAKEAMRSWQENGREKYLDDGKDCAHILVYKAPDVDPAMLQQVPKEFVSNMARLQTSAPRCCEQDRADGVVAQQRKSYDPHGKFLPVPGKPEYKLLP